MSTPVKDCPKPEYPIRERAYTPEQQARRTREDRGLPHHPDGTGWAACPACDGMGETYRENVNPQMQDAIECRECNGTGCIPDGISDPLLDMREPRPWASCLDSCRLRYTRARRRAMQPCAGISRLSMVETALQTFTPATARTSPSAVRTPAPAVAGTYSGERA